MPTDDDREDTYGLVMPFVVTTSHGGPYEDEAFVAGVWVGRIDAELTALAAIPTAIEGVVHYTVPPGLLPQIDLIAMRHGFTMESEPWDEHPDEHAFVKLIRSFPPPGVDPDSEADR